MSEIPTHVSPHRKRFERNPSPAPIALTPRDIAIVRHVAALRFVNSLQAASLVGGSHQRVLRRLEALFDHEYLDRPRAQAAQLFTNGNRPTVYALAPRGARLLAEHDGLDLTQKRWTLKNQRATSLFVEHTIATSDFMTLIMLGARERGLRLVDHDQLVELMPEKTRLSRNPFALKAAVNDGMKSVNLTTVPDRLFSLVWPDDTRTTMALEIDTGSMPVKRRSFEGSSSLARKLAVYYAAHQQSKFEPLWGTKQLFVAFILPSMDRLENTLAVQRDLTNGAGSRLFLFTTELIAKQGVFANVWINGRGERCSIV